MKKCWMYTEISWSASKIGHVNLFVGIDKKEITEEIQIFDSQKKTKQSNYNVIILGQISCMGNK